MFFFLSRGDEMTNSKKKVYDNELRTALSITVEYSFRKKLSSGAPGLRPPPMAAVIAKKNNIQIDEQ